MALILIADDEEIMRKLVSTVLERAGHEVLAASNGLEAVALYRSHTNRIDLVITDVTMPVMDGYEAVDLIRATRPKAKIICMSGYSDKACPPGILLLRKPFTPDLLCDSVTQLLEPV